MKKILLTFLILLFLFALIRITTSTYENIKRQSGLKESYSQADAKKSI